MGTPIDNPGGAFPGAPSQEEWDQLSPSERRRVVDALPAAMTDAELAPPEGDPHFGAKSDALETLRAYFTRLGRSVYVAAELTVYYPGAPRFSPDVLAVLDVPVHERMKWVVSHEGRGLDWVLEVLVSGDRRKDLEENVRKYAALGIPEYFIYDRARMRLHAYRLPEVGAKSYVPIVGQAGRYASRVLGLELVIEGVQLRFYHATAELLTPRGLAAKLEAMVEEVQRDAEERVQREQERVQREEERATLAERRVVELLEEIDRLKKR
jgi:Uma2 family endonuclease